MKHVMKTLLLTFGLTAAVCGSAETDLTIERLTWAGIKMVADDTTVFIDAIGTDIWDGKAPDGLVPVEADTSRRYALITHAHNDHFDVETLKRILGERGYAIVHESIATYVASRGLQVVPAALYQPIQRGGFIFTPVPASDGFGAEQVSWVVSRGDKRYLHAGDTLWHGKWREIGDQYGPFDAVFLPINGARLNSDPMPETPGTMTPTQAVDAALFLRAKRLVPIHYGLNDPPYYTETPNPLETLKTTAQRRAVPVVNLLPGELMSADQMP
jgi:L-ascorbate metabolism protein UlaG (beta-lactamase superfamily)